MLTHYRSLKPSHNTTWQLLAPFLLTGVLTASCARAGARQEAPPAAAESQPAKPDRAAASATPTAAAAGARKVVSETTLALSAEAPALVAETASRLVVESGGYVASKQAEQANDKVVRVEMVLRIPLAHLETALATLRKTGVLLSEAQTGRDVTEAYADIEATLHEKRRLEQRLLAILDSAKSVKDMLEIEQELNRVRTDIERLDAQGRVLAQQAALATLNLSVTAPFQPVALDAESTASRFARAFAQGRTHSVNIGVGLIVVAGTLLPFCVPLAALYFFSRSLRRRWLQKRAVVS